MSLSTTRSLLEIHEPNPWESSIARRLISCSSPLSPQPCLFPREYRSTICTCLEHTFTWTSCSTCPGCLSLFFTQLIWDKWYQLFSITQLPKTMKLNEDIRPRDLELEHSWRILVSVQQPQQLSSIQEVRCKESPSRHLDHCRPHTRSYELPIGLRRQWWAFLQT